jgi:biotin carboxyl carrier protein
LVSSSSEAPLSESRAAAAAAAQDWKRLSGSASPEEFGAAWLALAGRRCGALRGVLVARKADSGRFAPLAFYPEGQPCGTFLADVAERALAEARPVVVEEESGRALGLAYPVERARQIEAVAAFEFPRATAAPEALLRELQWALPWIERRLAADEGAPAGDAPLAAMLASAASARRFDDAARAVATDLALVFGRERVSVGVAKEGAVRLVALSHTAAFDARLALPRAIAAAMEETLRADKALSHPAAEGDDDALAELAREGTSPILALPMAPFVYVLEGGAPLDGDGQRRLRQALQAVQSILQLQRQVDVPLAARAASAVRAWVAGFAGPKARRRQLLAGAALLVLAGLIFGKAEFRVAGDAVLEGSVRRVVTAPFDGYVAASSARAGDTVKEGASLAAIDDRDLRLERVRVASQRAQYARQIQEASAKHDRGQTQILQAQLAQADAQLELLDEQLRRARLTAPFDGLVISGDLSQSIGAAVRKGELLFEVAPLAGYRVVVFVDEGDIAAVASGQSGTLLLAAIPDASFSFSVTSVTPVARPREGRNTFRVEARLEGAPSRLRPGMEGVAKIDAGPRNVAWIWTRRFTNWARLTLWSIWP